MRAATLIVVLACGIGSAFAQAPHSHQHSFADADKWKAVFDDPARDAWQKPHEVMVALALKPEAAVADLRSFEPYEISKRLPIIGECITTLA